MESNEPIAQHVPGLFSLHPSGPHFSNFIHVHDHLQSKSTNIVFLVSLSFFLSLYSPAGRVGKKEEKEKKRKMIQLLFSVLFGEGFLVLIMMVKTPLRKLAIMGLDRIKRGRGPTVVKTISGTAFVVLMSSIYSMVKIQERSDEFGSINPTDQVLMTRHLLEASLMGFSMFLALIIDRLHHYLRELRMQRKSIEALKAQQSRGFEDGKGGGSDLKALLEEIASTKAKIKKVESEDAAKTAKANEIAKLKEKIKQLESEAVAKTADTNDIVSLKAIVKQLESEVEAKEKDAKTAEANTVALRKQLEGFHLEYERLSKENQNLRDQLKSIDRKVSHSDDKKNM